MQGLSLIIAGFVLGVPVVAAAWFLSSAQAQTNNEPLNSPYNSQTVELLVSSVSFVTDKKPFDDRDVSFVDSIAFNPEIGPSGTLLDSIDIPKNDTISVYTVETGDTLSSIALKFNVSQNTIRWANNLDIKSSIHIGQKLTILPITGVRHAVTKGDTIASISKKYKADGQEIANYNGIDINDNLTVGTIILVPDGEITAIPQVVQAKKITGTGVTSSVSATKGYYIRPVTLTGNPRIRKTQGFHDRYNAIDIGAPIGTPIIAMADGVVITTRSVNAWNGGYGGLTIVQHANGSQTLYAHQSKIVVTEGQKVKQGQKIGEVGSTGRSTGPHLHFEIRGIRSIPVLY